MAAVPTLDQIIDDVVSYADFEEVGSVARAKLFITAAKRYLLINPSSQSDQGSSMTMDTPQIQGLLHRAQQYVDRSVRSNGSSVRFLSAAEGFRR